MLQVHAVGNYESILNVKPGHLVMQDEITGDRQSDGLPPDGFRLLRSYLSTPHQAALIEELREVVHVAPLYTPSTPRSGKPMSVRMTNCGQLGWVTDKENGYRYQTFHPVTGTAWPAIPQRLIEIWQAVANYPSLPEACLVNFYQGKAKMSLHQDRDEADIAAPVVSISLGDSCTFRIGGTKRGGKTISMRLDSGDVVVLGGEARMAYHGVDRIVAGTSSLLREGGRINLTLRRVNPPPR